MTTAILTKTEAGRAAFFQQNVALDGLLREAFPTGCTLAEAIRWAEGLSDETVYECEVLG
jgi:hypothetical protein